MVTEPLKIVFRILWHAELFQMKHLIQTAHKRKLPVEPQVLERGAQNVIQRICIVLSVRCIFKQLGRDIGFTHRALIATARNGLVTNCT